jgi:hypothetical protein
VWVLREEADMTKPTGKTYDIRTVRDFLQVPPDRIKACLKDFQSSYAVVYLAGIQLKDITKTPLNWPAFIWTDDGINSGKIRLTKG